MKTETIHTVPAATDVRQLEIDAARMRGEAMADTLVAIGRLVSRAVRPLTAALAASREAARVRRELSALSDRELADIGIHRTDIASVAAGTFARPAPEAATAARDPKLTVIEGTEPAFKQAA